MTNNFERELDRSEEVFLPTALVDHDKKLDEVYDEVLKENGRMGDLIEVNESDQPWLRERLDKITELEVEILTGGEGNYSGPVVEQNDLYLPELFKRDLLRLLLERGEIYVRTYFESIKKMEIKGVNMEGVYDLKCFNWAVGAITKVMMKIRNE